MQGFEDTLLRSSNWRQLKAASRSTGGGRSHDDFLLACRALAQVLKELLLVVQCPCIKRANRLPFTLKGSGDMATQRFSDVLRHLALLQ